MSMSHADLCEMTKEELDEAVRRQAQLVLKNKMDLDDYFGGLKIDDLDVSCHDVRLVEMFQNTLESENEEYSATPRNSFVNHYEMNEIENTPQISKFNVVGSNLGENNSHFQGLFTQLLDKKPLGLSNASLYGRPGFLDLSKKQRPQSNQRDSSEQTNVPSPHSPKPQKGSMSSFSANTSISTLQPSNKVAFSGSMLPSEQAYMPMETKNAKESSQAELSRAIMNILKNIPISMVGEYLKGVFARNPAELTYFKSRYAVYGDVGNTLSSGSLKIIDGLPSSIIKNHAAMAGKSSESKKIHEGLGALSSSGTDRDFSEESSITKFKGKIECGGVLKPKLEGNAPEQKLNQMHQKYQKTKKRVSLSNKENINTSNIKIDDCFQGEKSPQQRKFVSINQMQVSQSNHESKSNSKGKNSQSKRTQLQLSTQPGFFQTNNHFCISSPMNTIQHALLSERLTKLQKKQQSELKKEPKNETSTPLEPSLGSSPMPRSQTTHNSPQINDLKVVTFKEKPVRYLGAAGFGKKNGPMQNKQKPFVPQNGKVSNAMRTSHGKALSLDLQQRLKLFGNNPNTASVNIKLVK